MDDKSFIESFVPPLRPKVRQLLLNWRGPDGETIETSRKAQREVKRKILAKLEDIRLEICGKIGRIELSMLKVQAEKLRKLIEIEDCTNLIERNNFQRQVEICDIVSINLMNEYVDNKSLIVKINEINQREKIN